MAGGLFGDEPFPGADEFELLEEIGHGTFSEVYAARRRADGAAAALKLVRLGAPGAPPPPHVTRELAALRALRGHPHVVELLSYHESGAEAAIALPRAAGDLRAALERAGGAPPAEAVAKALARGLLAALAAAHAAGLAHRDVAPGNCLVDGAGALRLADFGLARAPAPAGATPGVGTRWYKAPEILFGARSADAAADAWAAGCVLFELVAGRPLFPGASDVHQLSLVHAQLGSVDLEAWPGAAELPDWGKLVFPAAAARPWAEAAPGAPPAALELVAALVRYDPAARLAPAAALEARWFAEAPAPAGGAEVLAAVEALLALPRPRQPAEDAPL
jgi:cell cycle related kinase